MKRSALLRRSPIKRKSRVSPRNVFRRRLEFARCYGSQERVIWIQSLPCYGCGALGRSENAHSIGGGGSRKADADTIVPLDRKCHRKYDQHLEPFNTDEARDRVKAFASVVDFNWNMIQRVHDATEQ